MSTLQAASIGPGGGVAFMEMRGSTKTLATSGGEEEIAMRRSQDHRGHVRLVERGGNDVGSGEQTSGETWARVKRRLRAELGDDVFASWFARLEMECIVDGCAKLTVPTRFLKSWIEAHYAERVLSVYRSEAPTVARISISVRGGLTREGAATPKRNGEAPKVVGAVDAGLRTDGRPPAQGP